MVETRNGGAAAEKNVLWYKNGAIYELHVRSFYDSDGDGTGDFPGLVSKLDYLRDLGVIAVWLLPFYPSPLKDDGYDIADYYGVHPRYGTLGDFKTFLREAHRRGLRVITELVLNHTSDQHSWFQRARRARPGSRWRDYYVWSQSADKYKGARVIFKDTEVSNWTWDPLAKAYYWHRFYSHQPDLNFEHPVVQQEMFKVVDFWLELGVDGLRLDAVPYLFEREGTSCENLPETHAFLKKLRQHVDANFKDRMLLAEANQWPDDAAAYFGAGSGDECHMAFHFPLMPRLFMALRMEDRVPIVDILQQTPPIPETAQWALFLRNHDELTLEMVTDEERDYMYRMYAQTNQARLNLGIRRRLAPLVSNDRRRIELLCALQFSLPGTPVIYYGDEIGMGENIYLGDRNGVRTPMQWSADKNAGFSRADPQRLYLPINLDPENHYEAVNVEVQERNPHSLLWWMRRLIALQKRWPAFGLGTLEFLHPENRKVLAFVRRTSAECILVVANLSRFVEPVELDLSAFQNFVPVELIGRAAFPAISDKPYFLTLGPHAFYLFSLENKAPVSGEPGGAAAGIEARTMINVEADASEIFLPRNQIPLERSLQSWLPSCGWFDGQTRTIRAVHVQEIVPLTTAPEKIFLTFIQVEYVQMESEVYLLPLASMLGKSAESLGRDTPALIIARLALKDTGESGVLYDALENKVFGRALLDLISRSRKLAGNRGELQATPTPALRRLRSEGALELEPSSSKPGQSDTFILYGDRLILKLFRRLEVGIHPDLEITRFLSAQQFPHAPLLAGSLQYRSRRDESLTVGMLTAFVPGSKDAWEYTLDSLGRFYERVQTLPGETRLPPPMPAVSLTELAAIEPPGRAREVIGTYLESARLLGERTAALHLALASEASDPNFAPESSTSHSMRGLFQSMRNLTRQNFQLLAKQVRSLPSEIQPLAQEVLGLEAEIIKRFRALYERDVDGFRIRHHGDYHLGQILYTGKDFFISDFSGEPTMALSERRLKRSPLRDVAGMIWSFHCAAHAALRQQFESGRLAPAQRAVATAWMWCWTRWISAEFYKAYRRFAGAASFLPSREENVRILLDSYLLRKVVNELDPVLQTRPGGLEMALQTIRELIHQDTAT